MGPISRLTQDRSRPARRLKAEIYAVYLALRDPRTPWYARLVAGLVVAYALSPLDLIPDPVPVLGHLDDLILVPLGVALALRLIPNEVLADARQQAAGSAPAPAGLGRWGAAVVLAGWALGFGLVAWLLAKLLWG